MDTMQKQIFTCNNAPDEVKGTIFRENRMGDHNLPMHILFFCFLYLKSVLCVYEEYAKHRKKPEKFTQLHYFWTKAKKFFSPCFITWIGLNDQKTISRYCPFKYVLQSLTLLGYSFSFTFLIQRLFPSHFTFLSEY